MKKIVTTGLALFLAIATHTCKQIREGSDLTNKQRTSAPRIEIAPLRQGREQWKIAATNEITVTITAPGAEGAQIQARPEGVEERYLELQTLGAPVDRVKGIFTARLNLAEDFAGTLWAEAIYPGGEKKRTEPVALSVNGETAGDASQLAAAGGSVGTDESARSDKLTGGRIRRAKLIPGEPDIRITVNAPAYLLTLWQNGREVSAYPIGIGRKNFPLPVGERQAAAIIFNPHWIPSESVWRLLGEGDSSLKLAAENSHPPSLSEIKIPLGAGYMIREATKAGDIGQGASQGSIMMRKADLLDLAEKILTARGAAIAKPGGALLGHRPERLATALSPPLLVDINYDLQVVEGGALHVYPDVYDRGAFALDSLRAELQGAGVASALLDDQRLRRILDQVSFETQFVINVADIRKGRWKAGRSLPLVVRPVEVKREFASALGDAGRISR
jgi:hypothetical protein